MRIKLIVAVSENNVIGVKNDLPWHLPDDMDFFKKKTINSSVIMGKNNYLSIPEKFRPLKNRINIILTKSSSFSAKECIISSSIEHALKTAQKAVSKTKWRASPASFSSFLFSISCD